MNFLRSEGFKFNEEEGLFSFKFQGTTFISFKNDSPYLQIILICNTKNVSKERVMEACNEMNADKFVLKLVARDETVWCSYEFMPSEHTSSDDFSLILTILDKGSDELFEKLRN